MSAFEAPAALALLAAIPILWLLWRLKARAATPVGTLSLLRRVAERRGERARSLRLPPRSLFLAAAALVLLALGGAGARRPGAVAPPPDATIVLSADPSLAARAGAGSRLEWLRSQAEGILAANPGRRFRLETGGAGGREALGAAGLRERLAALPLGPGPAGRPGEAAFAPLPEGGAGPRYVFTTGEPPPGAGAIAEAPAVGNAGIAAVSADERGVFVRVGNFSGAEWKGTVRVRPGDPAGVRLSVPAAGAAGALLSPGAGPGAATVEIASDGGADGYPGDDAAAVPAAAGVLEIAVHGSPPPALRAALGAMPGVRIAARGSAAAGRRPALVVYAGVDPPDPPDAPFLWVHPKAEGLGARRIGPDRARARFAAASDDGILAGLDLGASGPGLVAPMSLPPAFEVLASGADAPGAMGDPVLARRAGAPGGFLVACDLEGSPWVERVSFPVFVHRAISELRGGTLAAAALDLSRPLVLWREEGRGEAPAEAPAPVRAPLFLGAAAALLAAWALEARGR